MGIQLVKQPDGKFAIWSSIVDNFVLENATEEEVRTVWMKRVIDEAIDRANFDMDKSFKSIAKTGTDNWGKTYEEFMKDRNKKNVCIGVYDPDNVNPCETCDPENPSCGNCLGA